jgi:hypothetical protein
MTASGVWVITDGQWFGLIPTIFFGLGLLVALILLLPNSSFLELDSDGFVVRNLFRDSRLSWAHVDGFEVRRIGIRKMVTLTCVPSYSPLARARTMMRTVAGSDGALPDTYGMSAEDLAHIMNERLELHRQAASNAGAK